MSKKLFRPQAVAAYRDPDQRGGLVKVRPASGAIVFAVLASLVIGALVATGVTQVKVTGRGRGVILPEAGVVVVRAPASMPGRAVDEVLVKPGMVLEARAPVARIGGTTVLASAAGTVDAVVVQPGQIVAPGQPLVELIPDGELRAYLAIPAKHRSALGADDLVRLDLDEHPAEEAGPGYAMVRRVGQQLLTAERGQALFGPAHQFEEACFLVELDLKNFPQDADGAFRPGMLFTGEVTLEKRPLAAMLFPSLFGG